MITGVLMLDIHSVSAFINKKQDTVLGSCFFNG